jgi:hypothetical protein
MRFPRVAWPILIATLACVLDATAQEAGTQEHRGFWIGFGLGGGWNTGTALDGTAEAGMGAYGRLGLTASQRLLVGLESIAWVDAQIGRAVTRANSTLTAMFYPSRAGGLYMKGGVGVSTVQWVTPVGGEKGNGGAVTLGIGYDIRLGSNLYLSPNVDFLFQSAESGGVQTDNSISLFTLGLVWH